MDRLTVKVDTGPVFKPAVSGEGRTYVQTNAFSRKVDLWSM